MSADLDRRVANIIRYGVIIELDETHDDGPRAKVDLGDDITDWLPWLTLRAGADKDWYAPEPGEQVIVLSPSGEIAQGCILTGIFSDANASNGNRKTLRRTTYADGTVIEYDRAAHKLTVDASASNGFVVVNVGSGNVTVNCNHATVNATTDVTLNTPLTHCTGMLTVDGLLTYNNGILGHNGSNGHSIVGNINVTSGDVIADGIGLKSHHHTEQGDGAPTSAAQA